MKRRTFLLSSTATASVPILGALPGYAQTGSQAMGGEIRVAFEAQPKTLDPHMTTADATAQIARNVFEQLLTLNEGYQYKPMLAKSFEASEDGLVYTFYLRRGVMFHNGKEMKAEDVVASLTKWVSKNSKAKMFEGHTLEARDEYTVVLTLAKKVYGVLEAIADNGQFSGIMPKEIAEAAPVSGVEEYIGTGPFRLSEWRQDQFVRLDRFDDYVPVDAPAAGLSGAKAPKVDSIVYHFISDPSTRLAGLLTEEYDAADNLPIDYYDQVQSHKNTIGILERPLNLVAVYNKAEGIMSNATMRHAVNAALNCEEIMSAVQSRPEFFRLNSSYMYQEQSNWYSEEGSEFYDMRNPDAAKALLAEAGYDGEPIRILASKSHAHLFNSCVVINEQLKKAGFNTDLMVFDWPTVLEHRGKQSDWDITVTGMPFYLAPTQLLFLSSAWAGWTQDATITDIVEQIHASTSLDDARNLWQDLQKYCWEDYLPVSKLGDRISYWAYSKRLENISMVAGPAFWNAGFTG